MKLARLWMYSSPIAGCSDREVYPVADLQSDNELSDAVRRSGNTTYRVTGTFNMAPTSDPAAVVAMSFGYTGLRASASSTCQSRPPLLPPTTTQLS